MEEAKDVGIALLIDAFQAVAYVYVINDT